MRSLLLALVLLAACASSEPLTRFDSTMFPAQQIITPVRPTRHMRRLWDQVSSCAVFFGDRSKTYEQLKFFIRTPVSLVPSGNPVFGEYVSDTIFITRGFEQSDFILAHELLHHKLNGAVNGIAHPEKPFYFPCELDISYLKRAYRWSEASR